MCLLSVHVIRQVHHSPLVQLVIVLFCWNHRHYRDKLNALNYLRLQIRILEVSEQEIPRSVVFKVFVNY